MSRSFKYVSFLVFIIIPIIYETWIEFWITLNSTQTMTVIYLNQPIIICNDSLVIVLVLFATFRCTIIRPSNCRCVTYQVATSFDESILESLVICAVPVPVELGEVVMLSGSISSDVYK